MQGSELCTVRAGWVGKQALGTEGTVAFQIRSDYGCLPDPALSKKNVGPGKTGGREERGRRESGRKPSFWTRAACHTPKSYCIKNNPTKKKHLSPNPVF